MADAPAGPLEKLYALRAQAKREGMAYDENAMRAHINQQFEFKGEPFEPLEMVANPETFGESPEFKRMIRMDDQAARKEQDELAEKVAALKAKELTATGDVIRLERENEDLRARLARLEAAMGVAPAATAVSAPAPSDVPQGTPTLDWGQKDLVAYARNLGVDLPRGGVGISKADLLDRIQAAQAAA